jgi:predicted DNA-binding protein (UPF0251 family)
LTDVSRDTEQQNLFNPSPFDTACEKEEQQFITDDIIKALAKLKPRQQKILKLRYYMDMSYTDIAKSMGISEGNVGFMLHDAKRKLKKAYEDSFEVIDYVRKNKNRHKPERGTTAGVNDCIQPPGKRRSGGKEIRRKGIRSRRSKSCTT